MEKENKDLIKICEMSLKQAKENLKMQKKMVRRAWRVKRTVRNKEREGETRQRDI